MFDHFVGLVLKVLNSEIALEALKKPYSSGVFTSSSRLPIYARKKIKNIYDFQRDIQCITTELSMANKKYLSFSIYRQPKQNINFFLHCLSERVDFYSKSYENILRF